MFNLTTAQKNEICTFAYEADKESRGDLVNNIIVNENDYTSNFTSVLRRKINKKSIAGLTATAQLLTANNERALGCDAIIIICDGAKTKIVVFEAKLLRQNQAWDRTQNNNNPNSHFSHQLQRQANYVDKLAIFEMFYCNYAFTCQPNNMQDYVSACVWHSEAATQNNVRPTSPGPWDDSDLSKLLAQHPAKSISDILGDVCDCKKGIPIHLSSFEAISSEFSYLSGPVVFIQRIVS
jgi:hypothetical protein